MRKNNTSLRNITGRNVTPPGTRLNSGLDTISKFNLVTSSPMQLSGTTRMRFTNAQSSYNDYLSADNDISQFKINSSAVLADGVSYSNKFIAKHSQFIAPYGGYVKSIKGYMVPYGSGSCDPETITISVWSKTATIAGISDTPMNLIFSQDLAFTNTNSEYVLDINSALNGVYNKLTMSEGEGVIISIKRAAGFAACVKYTGSLTMLFESTDTQGTVEEFMLPSLSESNHRIDETISSPDLNYRSTGSTSIKISD